MALPFVPGTAIRLTVWVPPDLRDEVAMVPFAADKAWVGDVFYDDIGPRAGAGIDSYQFRTRTEGETDE